MDLENYDWSAFAGGFCIALLLALVIRWRQSRRRVDALHPPPRPIPTVNDLPPELRTRILKLKAEGQLIDAIKLVRKGTGLSLTQAKQLVEQIR